MLEGRRLLVTGVVTKESIAFAAAREAQLAGAEVLLTSFGRARSLTERAARRLPEPVEVLELDVTSQDDLDALAPAIAARWDRLDGVLHSIAYAPPDAIGGGFLQTPDASAIQAFRISAFSLKSLTTALLPVLASPGGSIVGLDFDASVSWPVYDWMGVAKAALESVSRYLARDLGPRGIRVNLVAAGPLNTISLRGIPGAVALEAEWARRAPLGWDGSDPTPVGRAACFLLSSWSEAITGEILHVDGGFHSTGVPNPALAAAEGADETPAVVVAAG
jgi:enoyl-[acyl-carrier protein] reductase I